MKHFFPRQAIILAALLQVLPIVRNLVTSPAASSSFAIVLRWTLGTSAAVGAFDSVSRASVPVAFTNPTNFFGTVGVFFSNNVAIIGNAGDSGAYFILNNSNTFSAQLTQSMTTTNCMPNGLTFKVYDPNNGGSAKPIYGAMYGTVANSITNLWVHVFVGYSNTPPASNNIFFTFTTNLYSAPIITNQPVGVATSIGANATFSVTNGGTSPFIYQWYFNTNTALPKATNFSLTITNVQSTNSGSYNVNIINGVGITNSAFALLSIAQGPAISRQPVGITNLVSSNATFSVTNGGTPPFTYQWYFNTNTALPNATNFSLTLTNLQLTNAGYYLVAITNSAGSTNSSSALLTVWQPPVITNQPASFTNVAGGNAGFSVVASGTPALTYQWQFNTSTALANATSSALNFTNIRASQAGTYTVILTNSAGSFTSAPALLVVTMPASPQITAPAIAGGLFQFTFNPVAGLTNSVLTNNSVSGGSWVVMTNVPPPATTNPVTVSDTISGTNRFYEVQIIP